MQYRQVLGLALVPFVTALPQYETTGPYNQQSYESGEQRALPLELTPTDGSDAHLYTNEALYDWAGRRTTEYMIHPSCNGSQTAILSQALYETEVLAGHGRDHILRFGNSSSYFLTYFGDAPSAEPAGWFNKIVNADKNNVLFRCDNPDGNCDIEGESVSLSLCHIG